MARYDLGARSGADRTNLYDDITSKIIAELEQGRLPWGASPGTAPLGLPKNASTGRTYSGMARDAGRKAMLVLPVW